MANTKKSAAPAKKASKKAAAPAQKRTTKAKAVASPAPPVVETVSVPETTPALDTSAPVEEKSSATLMATEFTAYLAKLQQAVSLLSTLRQEFRVLERKTPASLSRLIK